jgi:hypothetical protein
MASNLSLIAQSKTYFSSSHLHLYYSKAHNFSHVLNILVMIFFCVRQRSALFCGELSIVFRPRGSDVLINKNNAVFGIDAFCVDEAE